MIIDPVEVGSRAETERNRKMGKAEAFFNVIWLIIRNRQRGVDRRHFNNIAL